MDQQTREWTVCYNTEGEGGYKVYTLKVSQDIWPKIQKAIENEIEKYGLKIKWVKMED